MAFDVDVSRFRGLMRIAAVLSALMVWPAGAIAQLPSLPLPPLPGLPGGGDPVQSVLGQASGASITVPGLVTSLADTGTLTSASDPLYAEQAIVSIPGLLSAEALHSAIMGWTDQIAAQSSLTSLVLSVAGTGITADSIVSQAQAVSGAAPVGGTSIGGLTIGGVPFATSGLPNEQVFAPGLVITVNEQLISAGGIVVNALRVRTLDGLTNIVLGSARAGM